MSPPSARFAPEAFQQPVSKLDEDSLAYLPARLLTPSPAYIRQAFRHLCWLNLLELSRQQPFPHGCFRCHLDLNDPYRANFFLALVDPPQCGTADNLGLGPFPLDLETLEQRYARGEINREEYLQKKQDINNQQLA